MAPLPTTTVEVKSRRVLGKPGQAESPFSIVCLLCDLLEEQGNEKCRPQKQNKKIQQQSPRTVERTHNNKHPPKSDARGRSFSPIERSHFGSGRWRERFALVADRVRERPCRRGTTRVHESVRFEKNKSFGVGRIEKNVKQEATNYN